MLATKEGYKVELEVSILPTLKARITIQYHKRQNSRIEIHNKSY